MTSQSLQRLLLGRNKDQDTLRGLKFLNEPGNIRFRGVKMDMTDRIHKVDNCLFLSLLFRNHKKYRKIQKPLAHSDNLKC